MTQIITSSQDIVTWVQERIDPFTSQEDAESIARAIGQGYPKFGSQPAYGDDWSDYLDTMPDPLELMIPE